MRCLTSLMLRQHLNALILKTGTRLQKKIVASRWQPSHCWQSESLHCVFLRWKIGPIIRAGPTTREKKSLSLYSKSSTLTVGNSHDDAIKCSFFALIQTTGSGLVAQEELAEALNHFGKTH